MSLNLVPSRKPEPNESALCAVAFKGAIDQNIYMALFVVKNFSDFTDHVAKISLEQGWVPVQSSIMPKSDLAKMMAFNWNIAEPQFTTDKSIEQLSSYVRYVFEAGTEKEKAISEEVINKFKEKWNK